MVATIRAFPDVVDTTVYVTPEEKRAYILNSGDMVEGHQGPEEPGLLLQTRRTSNPFTPPCAASSPRLSHWSSPMWMRTKSQEMLSQLEKKKQIHVVESIAKLDSVSPAAIKIMETEMHNRFSNIMFDTGIKAGGIDYVANVMNNLVHATATLIEFLV